MERPSYMPPISCVSDISTPKTLTLGQFDVGTRWIYSTRALKRSVAEPPSTSLIFYPMRGGHNFRKPGVRNAIDRDEIWHDCYWPGGKAPSQWMNLHGEEKCDFWNTLMFINWSNNQNIYTPRILFLAGYSNEMQCFHRRTPRTSTDTWREFQKPFSLESVAKGYWTTGGMPSKRQ